MEPSMEKGRATMVHESMSNLRFDRRLLARRGWISPDELERVLQELPDVSAKGERVDDDEAVEEPAGTPPLPGPSF